jgi:hypothetical protein
VTATVTSSRPCPRLKPHRTGQAYCAWKVGGRRRFRYFGVWGSEWAAFRYGQFRDEWEGRDSGSQPHEADPPPEHAVGCRFCGRTPANRPKRLCCRCSKDPAIRERYGSKSRRGIGADGRGPRRPAPHPTDAYPGTPEKLAVLIARAAAGVELWHADDAGGW